MTTQAVTWTRFTDTTWQTIGGTIHRDADVRGWETMHDLEHEMADRTGLDPTLCQALVSAAKNNMPVEITWENEHGDGVEITSGIVMVDAVIMASDPTQDQYVSRVRLRYLGGFAHYVYLSQIRAAALAGTRLSFRDNVTTAPHITSENRTGHE